MTARAFDENAMKATEVTPKMAGIESTAKIRSATMMRNSTANSSVAHRLPPSRTKKRSPR